MERDFAGAMLASSDFRRLEQLCHGDPKFPASFEDWDALVSDGIRQTLVEGREVQSVAVDVDGFAAWCARVGMQPCLDALRAFLIIARRAGRPAAERPPEMLSAPHGTPPRGG